MILRVVEGEGPVVSLERGLDLFVVVLLLAMGILGLSYMRGQKK